MTDTPLDRQQTDDQPLSEDQSEELVEAGETDSDAPPAPEDYPTE